MVNKKRTEVADCIRLSASNPISYSFNTETEGKIMCVRATAHTQSQSTVAGECKVTASALFTAIFQNDDGFFQNENTVTFDIVFKDERITENSLLSVNYTVNDIRYEQNGDEYVISAIIDSEADFLIIAEHDYAENIDGAIVKTQDMDGVCRLTRFTASGDFDGEKECAFEIAAMLYHEEHVRVTSSGAGADQTYVGGEIVSEFLLVTKRGELVRESLVGPFRFEGDCPDCPPDAFVTVFAEVTSASYRVENSDEKRSVLSGIFTVDFTFNVFKRVCYHTIADAFSESEELYLVRDDVSFTQSAGTKELKYKCFGEATSDKGDDYVLGVIGSGVYPFDYKKDGNALVLSGVIKADIAVRNKEGNIRKASAEMPFECSFDYDGEPMSVTCSVMKYVAKDLDGKCVVECELLFLTQFTSKKSLTVISEAEPGETKKPDNCAVRIVFVEKGDDAWSVCKKAGVSEERLLRQNPDLVFPAEKDTGIIIYRKLENE